MDAIAAELGPGLGVELVRDADGLDELGHHIAVKFTEDGTVTLLVLHGVDDIRVLVRDTGTGIAADSLDRIFEPYEQADDTVQRTHGGTGLGLAISRQLVREMGGDLTAQSTSGKGSTFVCCFPRSLVHIPDRMQA